MDIKQVKYINRDYLSLKEQLILFVKRYFPDTWQDFSENSSGMSLLEMVAYVGDVLSYYQDYQFNESFLESANEYKNIVSLAKNLGYKPRGKKPSYAKVNVTCNFSSSAQRNTHAFILKKGTQFASKINPPVIFETLYDLDFSKNEGLTYYGTSGNNFYVTKGNVDVVSGITKTFETSIGNPKKYQTITIPDKNIFEINSVTDSEGNKYYEVDSLSQDTLINSVRNLNSSSGNVEYNLQLKYVPRRFVRNIDGEGYTTLIFGTGIRNIDEFDFIPSPEDYTLNLQLLGKNEINVNTIQQENFLNTNSLGHAPYNTTLTISYITGGGAETSVAANTITKLIKSKFDAKNVLMQKDSDLIRIVNSISVNNPSQASGGDGEDKNEDIKYIAPKYFAAQLRMNTLQDFIATSKSMPSKFGSVYRCSAKVDSTKNNTINLYILSKVETNGVKNFQFPNDNLIVNLKKYLDLYRSFNDVIVIKSAKIINIGIDYNIKVDARYGNTHQVLANTILALKDYFDIKNWEIEQPIYLSKVSNIITSIQGVLAVYNLNVIPMQKYYQDREYNESSDFSLYNSYKSGTVICPSNSIFEVKFPLHDINASFSVE